MQEHGVINDSFVSVGDISVDGLKGFSQKRGHMGKIGDRSVSMRANEGDSIRLGDGEMWQGPVDFGALLQRISSMDPEARQALKHHLSLYEGHDYKSLMPATTTAPINAETREPVESPTDAWKRKLKASLGQPKYQHNEKFESLNYAGTDDHILSRQHRAMVGLKHPWDKLLAQWTIFIVIGMLTGITAYGLKRGEEFFGHWRLEFVLEFVAEDRLDIAFFHLWWISTLFVTIAIFLTLLAPEAAGSGVPDVKALLNGVRIRGMLGFRAFAVKVLGVLFGVASGLAMGPEGPMIHAGAILAGGISQANVFWPFQFSLPFMSSFRNDTFKRDCVSAGAAAGVAAAFGAPIGGLLFSMEEASSFWSASQTVRTMITCMFATFTMTLLVYGGDRFNDPGLVHFGVAEAVPSRYRMWELAVWIPLAVAGGILGALFNHVAVNKIAFVGRMRKKWVAYAEKTFGMKRSMSFPIVVMTEAWIVITILCVGNFQLARAGYCLSTPLIDLVDSNGQLVNATQCDENTHGLHFLPFTCTNSTLDLDKEGTENKIYSDLATVSLLPQLQTIRDLLSRDVLPSGSPFIFSYRAMAIYFVAYFVFTVLTAGLFMPQGLFVPHIMIGALGGRLYGMMVHSYIGEEAQPGTYALLGAASMLAGSTRITISLSVILFEITNDIQYLVPIMLVVVIAKNIGSLFNEPYYDALLEMRHVPVLEEEPPHEMELFHVGDLMATNLRCCVRLMTVRELCALLEDNKHASYPVVRGKEDQTLLGAIPSYKEFRILEDKLRTESRHTIDITIEEIHLAEDHIVDLLPYTNLSTLSIPPTFSLAKAFNLFRSMGLRHIIVVNTAHAPIGMITREELQTHFLDVWLQREEEKNKNNITIETLAKLPHLEKDVTFRKINPARINSVHEQVEFELTDNFGSMRGRPEALRNDSIISNYETDSGYRVGAGKEPSQSSPAEAASPVVPNTETEKLFTCSDASPNPPHKTVTFSQPDQEEDR